MLRAVPMVFLRVQVSSKDAQEATRCIAHEGVLHLVDLAHGRVQGLSTPAGVVDLLAAFRDLERRIRRAADRMGLRFPPTTGALTEAAEGLETDRQALEARLRPIERAVDEAWEALARAKDQSAQTKEALDRGKLLQDAGVDVARLLKLQFAHVRMARATEENLNRAASLVAPTPYAFIPISRDGERWTFAAASPASSKERLEQALRLAGCETLSLPSAAQGWDVGQLQATLDDAERRALQAQESLNALKAEHQAAIAELLGRAQTATLLLQAQTHFATSGRFVVISGWLPAAAVDRLKAAIAKATGDRAVVDVYNPEAVGEVAAGYLRVPILHRNPVLLRPFQKLIQIYGTPSYEEVEPTAFFALSFLLMFGLMFGDVGHGAVLFAAGWCLFRYMPRFLDYGIILMEAGVSSVLFGVLYGSVFGVETLLPALWLKPMQDLTRFMTLASVIGMALLTIGTVLNVINAWRTGHKAQALFGVHGLFGGFLYWTALALVVRAFLPKGALPSWIIWALGGAALALFLARPVWARAMRSRSPRSATRTRPPLWLTWLEGSIELVDALFSFFTNTLSFVRIAAFAAVHAGLMVAIFALADTLAEVRFGTPLSWLMLLVGNALVILLEGLTATVQTLRLEYYEFFSRFFRGGGEPYQPFSLRPAAEKGVGNDPSSETKVARRGRRPPPAGGGHAVHPGVR